VRPINARRCDSQVPALSQPPNTGRQPTAEDHVKLAGGGTCKVLTPIECGFLSPSRQSCLVRLIAQRAYLELFRELHAEDGDPDPAEAKLRAMRLPAADLDRAGLGDMLQAGLERVLDASGGASCSQAGRAPLQGAIHGPARGRSASSSASRATAMCA